MADSQRYCLTASLKMTDHQRIDIGNVMTLLQKAENEKIEALLDECVKFCHSHTELVLSQHGGAMSALSDDVLHKMAALFDHNEVDELNDKKDRIKSRLYRHLTERLLGQLPGNADGRKGEVASSSVTRCRACQQLLTAASSSRLKCLANRVMLDRHGNTIPRHDNDERWDVTSYVRDVYFRHRSWRCVYWSLWAQLMCLTCDKCGLTFPCHRLGQCLHHAEAALYAVDHDRGVTASIGTFPCCQQVACKFDPWDNLSKGCAVRDHVVVVVNPKDPSARSKLQDLLPRMELILATLSNNQETDGLISNRNAASATAASAGTTKTAARQAFNASVLEAARRCAAASAAKTGDDGGSRRTCAAPSDDDDSEEEDEGSSDCSDAVGGSGSSSTEEEEVATFGLPAAAPPPVAIVQQQQQRNKPTLEECRDLSVNQSRGASKWPVIWDGSRSRRYNHDVLRDYEQRRFQQMVAQIGRQRTRLSGCQQESGGAVPCRTTLPQMSSRAGGGGGIYERLASEWRTARAAPPAVASFPQRAGVMAIARFKRTKKLLTANATQP